MNFVHNDPDSLMYKTMSFTKRYFYETLMVAVVIIVGLLFFLTRDQQTVETTAQESVAEATMSPAKTTRGSQHFAPPDLLATKPQVILRMDGSNTIGAKLAPALAAGYLRQLGSEVTVKKDLAAANEVQVIGYLPNQQQVVAIEIKAHGSSTGFKSLVADETDIAMSSRGIKTNENLDLLLKYGDMTLPENEHVIALDGLAIIKHPDNPLATLTVAQLAQIFSGQIKNWSELGGKNAKINLYARDDQSGTYDTFNSLVLKKFKQKLAPAQRFESNELLAQSVAADVSGIGFTGLAYANKDMIVQVSAAPGLPAIEPQQFSISSEDYALSRRLFLYANTSANPNPHVAGLIDFAITHSGQQVVEQVSFIPQKITSVLPGVNAEHPPKYQMVAMNGERLSMTFRMRADRAEIDNKSAQDIEHLVEYLKATPHKKVTLIGFSAGESNDEQADRQRAYIRSRLLAYELRQRGIKNVEIIALGNQLPIDSNHSEVGRYRNNRTEVWLVKAEHQS